MVAGQKFMAYRSGLQPHVLCSPSTRTRAAVNQQTCASSAQASTSAPFRGLEPGLNAPAKVSRQKKADLVIETGEFRRNVGICLVNSEGNVFAARRVDDKHGTWQMPQGGIDAGGHENPMSAAVRELEEETGITSARIVALMDRWLDYEFPTDVRSSMTGTWIRYRGQTQMWCLLYFYGKESEICLDKHGEREFLEHTWMPLERLPNEVVDFKRAVYAEVAKEFAPIIHRRRGQQQLSWWGGQA